MDTPYRVEQRSKGMLEEERKGYEVVHVATGVICTCEEFHQARTVVDALNTAAKAAYMR